MIRCRVDLKDALQKKKRKNVLVQHWEKINQRDGRSPQSSNYLDVRQRKNVNLINTCESFQIKSGKLELAESSLSVTEKAPTMGDGDRSARITLTRQIIRSSGYIFIHGYLLICSLPKASGDSRTES